MRPASLTRLRRERTAPQVQMTPEDLEPLQRDSIRLSRRQVKEDGMRGIHFRAQTVETRRIASGHMCPNASATLATRDHQDMSE